MADLLDELAGLRVLIVEDEYVIAMDLKQSLLDCGAEVIGPAPSSAAALEKIAATDRLDGAIVDLKLSGEWSYAVADALRKRRIPFVFATAYEPSVVSPEYADTPILEKPVSPLRVAEVLAATRLRLCG